MKTKLSHSCSSILLTSFLAIFLLACEDPDLRFQEFEESETGAYARQISVEGNFVKEFVNASIINIDVEFYDKNEGKDVASYDWSVRLLPGGDASANTDEEIFLFSIPSDLFATNESGLPSIRFTLGMQETLDAMGLDIDSIEVGDVLRYEATVRTVDGKSFTSANTGPNMISQSTFGGLFRLNAEIF